MNSKKKGVSAADSGVEQCNHTATTNSRRLTVVVFSLFFSWLHVAGGADAVVAPAISTRFCDAASSLNARRVLPPRNVGTVLLGTYAGIHKGQL